jgi:hypothetical protein
MSQNVSTEVGAHYPKTNAGSWRAIAWPGGSRGANSCMHCAAATVLFRRPAGGSAEGVREADSWLGAIPFWVADGVAGAVTF